MRSVKFIIAVLIMLFVMSAAAEKSYFIDREKMTVNIGYAVTLHIKVKGSDEKVAAEWESSNPYVAWVDSDGAVHAECAGNVTVTARIDNGSTFTCKVNVPGNPVTSISFPSETVEIGTGKTKNFAANVNSKADKKSVTYVSYDESVVSIDEKGRITGVGKGRATIRATAVNGMTAYAEVSVFSSLESIALDTDRVLIDINGEPVKVNCILTPADTDEEEYTWSIKDKSVATVEDGMVTAVSTGKTELTCTSQNGMSVTVPVTVGILAQRIEAVGGGTVRCYEKTDFSASVYPDNATDNSFTWVIEHPEIACVTRKGVCYGLAPGETRIWAVANGGLDVKAELYLTVLENPDVTPKKVSLTFDDGPANNTLDLLAVLNDYNVKATFFVVGENVKKRPEITKAVYDSGNAIGNHTYSHEVLVKLSGSEGREQISKCDEIVKSVTGEYPKYLRAPGGDVTDRRIEILGTTRYFIDWTVDSRDWESRNTDSVYKTVMKYIKDRDVLLFHDLYPTTTRAVEKLLPVLIEQGYSFISLDEMMELVPPSKSSYIYLNGGK